MSKEVSKQTPTASETGVSLMPGSQPGNSFLEVPPTAAKLPSNSRRPPAGPRTSTANNASLAQTGLGASVCDTPYVCLRQKDPQLMVD